MDSQRTVKKSRQSDPLGRKPKYDLFALAFVPQSVPGAVIKCNREKKLALSPRVGMTSPIHNCQNKIYQLNNKTNPSAQR